MKKILLALAFLTSVILISCGGRNETTLVEGESVAVLADSTLADTVYTAAMADTAVML